MTLPDFDSVRPRPTDGVDPLSSGVTGGEPAFPHGDRPKTETNKVVFQSKPNAGFTPQPPAGIDLSVIDPLPNSPEYNPPESTPE